jgi:hypothetical protein
LPTFLGLKLLNSSLNIAFWRETTKTRLKEEVAAGLDQSFPDQTPFTKAHQKTMTLF